MSIILQTKEQITRSPLNTSVSKTMYTFPKKKRFDDERRKMGYYLIIYINDVLC